MRRERYSKQRLAELALALLTDQGVEMHTAESFLGLPWGDLAEKWRGEPAAPVSRWRDANRTMSILVAALDPDGFVAWIERRHGYEVEYRAARPSVGGHLSKRGVSLVAMERALPALRVAAVAARCARVG